MIFLRSRDRLVSATESQQRRFQLQKCAQQLIRRLPSFLYTSNPAPTMARECAAVVPRPTGSSRGFLSEDLWLRLSRFSKWSKRVPHNELKLHAQLNAQLNLRKLLKISR